MEFEWDSKKDIANRRKHGVGFREAATVFGDSLATTFPDTDHSSFEERFLTIGTAGTGRTMVVSHTEAENKIRIISARPATRSERRFYEESR